jgi:superfamily I DNA and RNA helicase
MLRGSGGMSNLARETRKKVDEAMSIIEKQVIKATTVDMAGLRPQITDKEAFDQLLAVVNEATQRNFSLAELQEKIAILDTNVKDAAIEVASIIKRIALF